MPDIRDQVWQFWGFIVGAVGLAIPIVLYVFQRRRKVLGYEVVASTRVVSVKPHAGDKLQVRFGDEMVNDAHVLLVTVFNGGNKEIARADYDRNFALIFNSGVRVLETEVISSSTNPPDATVGKRHDDAGLDIVELEPVLLNEGDWLTIKVLLDGNPGLRSVTGKIVGGKVRQGRIRFFTFQSKWFQFSIFLFLVLTLALGFSLATPQKPEPIGLPISFLLTILVVLFAWWGAYLNQRWMQFEKARNPYWEPPKDDDEKGL